MRLPALAALLLLAACGQLDQVLNQSSAEREASGTSSAPAPTITIAASGPGGCSASWDGQAVTPAQITERSFALVERAIAAVGGPQNVTETTFPVLDVEAPADLSFACADTILSSIQRAAVPSVRLRVTGSRTPILADFPLDMNVPPPPIPMVLGIGAGGRMTWNNVPIDASALAAELVRNGGSTSSPDPAEGGPPPGGMELRVSREATFGQVHDLLMTTNRYHLRPFLYLPSAKAGTGQSAPPPPPPPPPPPLPLPPPPPPS